MIAIEEKIDKLHEETEISVNVIIRGSDEHLDLILSIVELLNKLSQSLKNVNDLLYEEIKDFTEEQMQIVMQKLRSLNKICMTLIGAVRTSFLYRDVRTALKNYTREHGILLEIMHDIYNLRLAKDDEFDRILKELNDM